MLQALCNLYAANAGHVVFVGIRISAFLDAAQSPALRPGQIGVVPWDSYMPCKCCYSGRVIYPPGRIGNSSFSESSINYRIVNRLRVLHILV